MPNSEVGPGSLEELLASCSDTLFPAQFGKIEVTLQSRDVDGDTPLHVMIWRGNTVAALLFIDAGADVNAVGDMSETPLHVALRNQNLTVAEALLKAGADPHRLSEFGDTARDLTQSLGGEFRALFDKDPIKPHARRARPS